MNATKCRTTLSWDEKYPASYEYKPSPVFAKWAKEKPLIHTQPTNP